MNKKKDNTSLHNLSNYSKYNHLAPRVKGRKIKL